MLFFVGFLCSRIGQKQCCTNCEWYPIALFQTAHFWKKFQMKLFLFQWIGPVFLSSSSPKVGICSNRSDFHISSFLRIVPVLWIIEKHCNKIIRPVTKKYVGQTPAVYKTFISLDFCILFLIAKFYKKLLKEKNVLQIVVTEQCFEKQYFDIEKWK